MEKDFDSMKNDILLLTEIEIRNIYETGDYHQFNKYILPQKVKIQLIENEMKKSQLQDCIKYFGISDTTINYFKLHKYNIYDKYFIIKTKVRSLRIHRLITFTKIFENYEDEYIDEIMDMNYNDVLIFKYPTKMQINKERKALLQFPLLTKEDMQLIITINYYTNQKLKINNILSGFREEHYTNIIANGNTYSNVYSFAIVCKMFNKIAQKVVISLGGKAQLCKTCNVCVFERRLRVKCFTCNTINKGNYLKGIINHPFVDDYLPHIAKYLVKKCVVNLGLVNKQVYNIVKKMIISCKPQIVKCKYYDKCKNDICITEKSFEGSICGECLGASIYSHTQVPSYSWARCCEMYCSCLFFVKAEYKGCNAICLVDRKYNK